MSVARCFSRDQAITRLPRNDSPPSLTPVQRGETMTTSTRPCRSLGTAMTQAPESHVDGGGVLTTVTGVKGSV
jgi:hypothetical protein